MNLQIVEMRRQLQSQEEQLRSQLKQQLQQAVQERAASDSQVSQLQVRVCFACMPGLLKIVKK